MNEETFQPPSTDPGAPPWPVNPAPVPATPEPVSEEGAEKEPEVTEDSLDETEA